ncbi:hypothetical protein BJ741DRAFT_604778 [Chytriomyces cf. hyalinus JEL632]|nr:hypothetical protein BJ741DRAFT_604778 [Chytriomyces cf. hyalinus JEL632]
MLSRMLYANPVCLLTTTSIPTPATILPPANEPAQPSLPETNVMTISWLTAIDNSGHFIASMNKGRYSAELLLSRIHGLDYSNAFFTLSVPVHGSEKLVVDIGSCSGRTTKDKLKTLGIKTCSPGWKSFQAPTATEDVSTADRGPKRSRKKEDFADEAFSRKHGLVAISQSVAHLICRVDEIQERHGHLILHCVIGAAFCKSEYWNGKNFAPIRNPVTGVTPPPYLTFLGTKVFAAAAPFEAVEEAEEGREKKEEA